MADWMRWALILGIPLAAIGLGILAGRWFYRRARRESGWNQWRLTAVTLSWRDRWRLLWATSSRRAVSDPRLAELAAQRAEAAHGLLSKAARRQTWLLRIVGLAQLVIAVSALLDDNPMGWFYLSAGFWTGLMVGSGRLISRTFDTRDYQQKRNRDKRNFQCRPQVAEIGPLVADDDVSDSTGQPTEHAESPDVVPDRSGTPIFLGSS